jgi:hypothetical protein
MSDPDVADEGCRIRGREEQFDDVAKRAAARPFPAVSLTGGRLLLRLRERLSGHGARPESRLRSGALARSCTLAQPGACKSIAWSWLTLSPLLQLDHLAHTGARGRWRDSGRAVDGHPRV